MSTKHLISEKKEKYTRYVPNTKYCINTLKSCISMGVYLKMKVSKEHHFHPNNNEKPYEPQNNHVACTLQRAKVTKQPSRLKSK